MISIRLLMLFVVALLAPLSVRAQAPVPDGIDRRLALYDAELVVAFEEGASKLFKEKVRDLDLKYFQAIDRALESATRAGLLEDALAIRDEKVRFAEASGVPAIDAAADPAALSQLRATYRTQLKKLEAERDLAAAPLLAEHDAKLEAYQTLLTTEGKLDEALKVKAARGKAAVKLAVPQTTPGAEGASGDGEAGWQVVFDGGDIKNWKPKNSLRNFPVNDGVLAAQIANEGADVLFFKGLADVPAILKNFELKATVRSDPEANSGFYFHLDGEDFERFPTTGMEVSLHCGAKPVKYPTGSIYGETEMKGSTVNQADWFEIHFKVVDRVVTVSINGEPYLEHLGALSTGPGTKGILADGGRLAIQANSRDGAFYFQRISIKPLD
jgi:hypothetical protein